MTPERWRQVSAVFNAALQRDAASRDAFLDEVCARDGGLKAEVIAMLKAHTEAGRVLHTTTFLGIDRREAFYSSQLGSYRLDSLLGAGGMGEVYRAYDQRLQREVAIKVLPETSSDDPEARARLLREARAAAALNHPNICTVHEVGYHEGRPFIAMELIEGESLDRLIVDGVGLPLDKILTYGIQIAEALAHAHDRGVVHRDLKTPNILIASGRAKVLDFGLAKRLKTHFEAATTVTAFRNPDAIFGTLAYMSPEQLRGEPADACSDVWAFGVVLHEMASGSLPFAGQNQFEFSAAILNDAPTPLPDKVPENLKVVIGRCLEKEPGNRYSQGQEVLEALNAVQAGTDLIPVSRPRWRYSRGAMITALITLLFFAVGMAWNVGDIRDWIWNRPPVFESIAVLPLENRSDADRAYFASGLQQALINELARLPGLTKVIARASTLRFQNSRHTPQEVGQALGVRAFVTGSFLLDGNRVRVDAQLVDTASGRQVWGDAYERPLEDVLAIQSSLIGDIAQAIELRLTSVDRQRLAKITTIRPETYEAYLRGMHELNSDRASGLAYLQQAVNEDPGDPFAYAGLAKGYATLGHGPAAPEDAWIQARAAAERAMTLAPDMADAYAVMADVKLYYERDWVGAERAFQRANDLNPNLAMNHYHYAWYLVLMDRLDEAIVEHERARDLDPLTPLHHAWLSDLYRMANRYEDAIAAANKSIEVNPDSAAGWQALGHVYSDLNRHDEAIAALKRAVTIAPPWTFALGSAYARAGRTSEARQLLATMQNRPTTSYNAWARAILHAVLGDRDEFFALITRKPQHAWVPWVRNDKFVRLVWEDPRFATLMTQFNLPMPK